MKQTWKQLQPIAIRNRHIAPALDATRPCEALAPTRNLCAGVRGHRDLKKLSRATRLDRLAGGFLQQHQACHALHAHQDPKTEVGSLRSRYRYGTFKCSTILPTAKLNTRTVKCVRAIQRAIILMAGWTMCPPAHTACLNRFGMGAAELRLRLDVRDTLQRIAE